MSDLALLYLTIRPLLRGLSSNISNYSTQLWRLVCTIASSLLALKDHGGSIEDWVEDVETVREEELGKQTQNLSANGRTVTLTYPPNEELTDKLRENARIRGNKGETLEYDNDLFASGTKAYRITHYLIYHGTGVGRSVHHQRDTNKYPAVATKASSSPPPARRTMAEKSAVENSSGGGGGAAASAPYPLPRVTIRFCTQCKWMLRAAYFAQELLSTFSTSLGEVALQPSTGGTFVVELFFQGPPSSSSTAPEPATPARPQHRVIWDRGVDGGFPETKELKRRVRDAIEPGRNLGHVDRDHHRGGGGAEAKPDEGTGDGGKEAAQKLTEAVATQARPPKASGEVCEDCQ
ncbi:hypothetical protein DL767_001163 [Monosporascus sp. MG133]|nr:hypothetical protein DL767_001163 [Monosporascus sp. MG133]